MFRELAEDVCLAESRQSRSIAQKLHLVERSRLSLGMTVFTAPEVLSDGEGGERGKLSRPAGDLDMDDVVAQVLVKLKMP